GQALPAAPAGVGPAVREAPGPASEYCAVTVTLDEADLSLVAAAASRADERALVDEVDVAALARISARSEEASTALEAGAAVLLGVLHERPFPSGNEAAAWLAAVHLLDRNAVTLHITDACSGSTSAGRYHSGGVPCGGCSN